MTQGERRLLIIHNPVSGSRNRKRLSKTLALLEKKGCHVTVKATEYSGHASELVQDAVKELQSWSAIVAAGGDGTISEVANGMRGTEIPLGVIPLGTANVLAREIGVGTSLRKATDILLNAKPVLVYPGLIGEMRFMLMVGAGYDSLAVAELDPAEKKRFGALAYVFAAFRAVKRFKDLDLGVTVDGQEYRGASVIVTRSRLFGGPFVVAPQADLRVPMLHVVILKNKGLWAALKYGAALATNRLWKLKSVETVQSKAAIEICAKISIPCQRDGDDGYTTPLTMTVDEYPLNLLTAYPDRP